MKNILIGLILIINVCTSIQASQRGEYESLLSEKGLVDLKPNDLERFGADLDIESAGLFENDTNEKYRPKSCKKVTLKVARSVCYLLAASPLIASGYYSVIDCSYNFSMNEIKRKGQEKFCHPVFDNVDANNIDL